MFANVPLTNMLARANNGQEAPDPAVSSSNPARHSNHCLSKPYLVTAQSSTVLALPSDRRYRS